MVYSSRVSIYQIEAPPRFISPAECKQWYIYHANIDQYTVLIATARGEGMVDSK